MSDDGEEENVQIEGQSKNRCLLYAIMRVCTPFGGGLSNSCPQIIFQRMPSTWLTSMSLIRSLISVAFRVLRVVTLGRCGRGYILIPLKKWQVLGWTIYNRHPCLKASTLAKEYTLFMAISYLC